METELDNNFDENIWRNIVNNITDAVFVLDKDGSILLFNDAITQLIGYTPHETTDLNTYQLFKKSQLDVHILVKVLEKKRTVTALQKYIRKDGSETPYMLVTQSPVLDEYGEVKYSVGIIRNMKKLINVYESAVRVAPFKIIETTNNGVKNFVYQSQIMKDLLENVRKVTKSDATILIQGESGVGKEILAEFIHHNSGRHGKTMVVVNCAALPESLLEAELFGYEKGAFTGAQNQGKQGLVELAHEGTLFLDEIDSMPVILQGKILRLLETKEVRRLGGVKSKLIDFRLLVATNNNLLNCIKEKTFRLDLYYRMSVLLFTIPPLRERKEDIRPLCEYFLQYYERKYGREKRFSEEIYQKLLRHEWSGNIRELKNFIERIVLITDVDITYIENFSNEMLNVQETEVSNLYADIEPIRENASVCMPYDDLYSLKENVAAYERWIITEQVKRYGSLSKAAIKLESSKATLSRKLNEGKSEKLHF